MSALSKLIDAPGLFASCGGPQKALDFAFASDIPDVDRDLWRAVFTNLVSILEMSGDEEMRLTMGKKSVLIRRSTDTYVGVVAQKGHPVVKSLQRMIRKSFKHFGAPVPSGRTRPKPPAPNLPPPPAFGSGPFGSDG